MGSISSGGGARVLLLESLWRRPLAVLGSLTLMGVSAAATAGYAWLVGPMVARVQEGQFLQSSQPSSLVGHGFPNLSWVEIVSLLVLLGLVRAASETARTRVTSTFQVGLVLEMRKEILARALALDPCVLARWAPGELAARIQVEVHGVRSLLHLGVFQGIQSIVVATALATVAIRVDSRVATWVVLLLPVALVGLVLAARPARRFQRALFAAESALISDTAEAVTGAAVLRAYEARGQAEGRIGVKADNAADRAVSADTWGAAAGPLIELAGAVAIAFVAAATWNFEGPVDLAATGALLAVVVLMLRPLRGLAQSLFSWSAGLAALDRIDELWALPEAPADASAARASLRSSIGLREVELSYGDRKVLAGVSGHWPSGEIIALTGPSGAGKSTLLSVLCGVLEPTGGHATLDGAPATRDARLASCAWMPQTPWLFRGTLLENIALGDPAPDRARALAAAQRAGAHGFIGAREGGYEGIVIEGGSDLSVGQRQRITLARALYRDAPILLLDEPTAGLDPAQEQNVLMACREHAEAGGLVVIATHRQDLLRHADRVVEVRNGALREWERREDHAWLN